MNDTSGNNYHGTHVGTPTYVTDKDGVGKAINLNGNKYVKVDDGQNQTVFNGDKKFTISTWVKEQPDGGWEPWISKRGEGGRGWQLRREGGGVVMFTTNGPSGGDGNLRKGMVWDNSKVVSSWPLCMVLEMVLTRKSMSMVSCLRAAGADLSIGITTCWCLVLVITIILWLAFKCFSG